MSILRLLQETIRDLTRGGARFAVGGVRAALGTGGQLRVSLPGGGTSVVRRGSDFVMLRQIFRDREYAPPSIMVRDRLKDEYRRILAAGKVPIVIDAGANIGAASLWFKRKYPEAAIVAIEPDPGNASLARLNTAHLRDVRIVEAAVGGQTGFASMVPSPWPCAIRTTRGDAGCPIITINDAIASVENGALFLVKIDIEGFESDLFANNTEWIDASFAVYIEPHDWMLPGQATSRGFQIAMAKREFELFIRGENLMYVRQAR